MSQTKAELIKGLNINASAPATALQIDASGNVNIDSNTLYVDATNNRVGIGTTSPTATLEVKGGQIVLNTTTANSSAVIYRINDVTKGYIGPAGILGGSDNDMGYRVESGNNQVFYVGASEAARIDSSRRLLVGTSTSASTTANVVVQGSSNGQLELRCATDPSSSGTALGVLRFTNNSGGLFAQIYSESDGTISSSSDLPGRLVFSTTADGASSPTERMRLTSGGYAKINCTTDLYAGYPFRLEVDGGASDVALFKTTAFGSNAVAIWNASTAGNGNFAYFYTESSPTGRGSIDYNRAAGQVRYNVTSDRRLKSDIQPAESALNALFAIQVRSYKWTETGYQVDHGFIAQELNEVAPDAVKVGDDGEEVTDTWAVDNGKLVPLLTKALQEAIGRIEALEARLSAAGIE